jgi:phospholipid/cholesterol/gamma-HCH transport system permease protein
LTRFLDPVGHHILFFLQLVKLTFKSEFRRQDLLTQIWTVTTQSLPTIIMAGFFVGAVMTIQFTLQMRDFGALSYLGGLATSGTFREVGPLLIGFMLCGKVGAFTASELGTMKITEQFDAIRCLGSDPINEIVLPRFLGIIISSGFLLVGGLFASILGGMFLGVIYANVSVEEYLRHIPRFLVGISILSGFVKSLVFSILLAAVCTYQGYHVTGGAKGVGRAVVRTAVISMVGIVTLDWLTSFCMEILIQIVKEVR